MKKLAKLTMLVFLSLGFSSCQEHDFENKAVLEKLYKWYKNGEICVCIYNNETVYSGGDLNIDGAGEIFDKDGNKIGSCNYFANLVDPICGKLTECFVIYRVKDNSMGLPAVDLLGLGR